MDLDDQFRRYFGVSDLTAISSAALAAGTEHMLVDFGLETDPSRRFGLWAVLYMLGAAPDLAVAFKSEADREAARDFMEMTERQQVPDAR